MRRFVEVVNELGLRDLPLLGGPFTWRGGLNGRSMSCLDRFLVSTDWESKFSKAVQSTLPRPVSDYCPILLDCEGIKSRPCPFWFEIMWLKYEGFKDLLRDWWQNMQFFRSFSFVLASKIKALKGILKVWNKEVFGRVGTKKKEALRRVVFWDDLEKEKELSCEEVEEREKARKDYKNWVDMEEVSWRQKSRELWLKEGDRNTGFFPRMANSHRRRNTLLNISIHGRRLAQDTEIKEGLVDAFQNLLSAPNSWLPPLPDLPFNVIGDEQVAKLVEMFTEEEILAAISGLNGDIVPGPDGFPLAFWSFS